MTGLSDDQLRAAYAAIGANAATTPHPSPEVLAALAERRGSEVERLRTLDHVGSCAGCRRQLALLRATHAAARQFQPSRWRMRAVGMAAAAGIVVVAALSITRWTGTRAADGPIDRGAPPTGPEHTIALIAPIGSVTAHPIRFLWHRVPAAGAYHLEVLDESGAVVARSDARDTVFAVPGLAPGRVYRWWVQAKANGELWRSEFGEIRTRQ